MLGFIKKVVDTVVKAVTPKKNKKADKKAEKKNVQVFEPKSVTTDGFVSKSGKVSDITSETTKATKSAPKTTKSDKKDEPNIFEKAWNSTKKAVKKAAEVVVDTTKKVVNKTKEALTNISNFFIGLSKESKETTVESQNVIQNSSINKEQEPIANNAPEVKRYKIDFTEEKETKASMLKNEDGSIKFVGEDEQPIEIEEGTKIKVSTATAPTDVQESTQSAEDNQITADEIILTAKKDEETGNIIFVDENNEEFKPEEGFICSFVKKTTTSVFAVVEEMSGGNKEFEEGAEFVKEYKVTYVDENGDEVNLTDEQIDALNKQFGQSGVKKSDSNRENVNVSGASIESESDANVGNTMAATITEITETREEPDTKEVLTPTSEFAKKSDKSEKEESIKHNLVKDLGTKKNNNTSANNGSGSTPAGNTSSNVDQASDADTTQTPTSSYNNNTNTNEINYDETQLVEDGVTGGAASAEEIDSIVTDASTEEAGATIASASKSEDGITGAAASTEEAGATIASASKSEDGITGAAASTEEAGATIASAMPEEAGATIAQASTEEAGATIASAMPEEAGATIAQASTEEAGATIASAMNEEAGATIANNIQSNDINNNTIAYVPTKGEASGWNAKALAASKASSWLAAYAEASEAASDSATSSEASQENTSAQTTTIAFLSMTAGVGTAAAMSASQAISTAVATGTTNGQTTTDTNISDASASMEASTSNGGSAFAGGNNGGGQASTGGNGGSSSSSGGSSIA
ncbi:MAG: hypothetical protein E7Z91_03270 [Cyanobacteria bacterium SIG30]|nr:hypothetical protein [Cyanobacteria bacterium SIG30]